MLYNDGDRFNVVYYDGKPVGTIFYKGQCIYPGLYDPGDRAVLLNGYIFGELPPLSGENIVRIVRSKTPPPDGADVHIISDSEYTKFTDDIIYAWVHNNTLCWYCKKSKIYANTQFTLYTPSGVGSLNRVTDISGLSDIDTSLTTDLRYGLHLFNVSDLSPIKDWDVHNVTSFYACFAGTGALNLLDLRQWDTSSAIDFEAMFEGSWKLTTLSGIENWNTSNVTTMFDTFADCSELTNLSALANWDISSVTNLYRTFSNCDELTDISGLADWDVSNVTNMNVLFGNCKKLSDISALSNWKINPECDMQIMFSYTNVTDFSPIYGWEFPVYATTTGGVDAFFSQTKITKFDFYNLYNVPDNSFVLRRTFYQCSELLICDLSTKCAKFDRITSFTEGVFQYCTKLHTLIIRNSTMLPFDSITNIGRTFQGTVLRSSAGKLYVPQDLIYDYTHNIMWSSTLLNYGCQILPLEGSPYEEPGSI